MRGSQCPNEFRSSLESNFMAKSIPKELDQANGSTALP